jgi:hypothetical protein
VAVVEQLSAGETGEGNYRERENPIPDDQAVHVIAVLGFRLHCDREKTRRPRKTNEENLPARCKSKRNPTIQNLPYAKQSLRENLFSKVVNLISFKFLPETKCAMWR